MSKPVEENQSSAPDTGEAPVCQPSCINSFADMFLAVKRLL
jgi:hypothetical protein